MLLSAAGNVGEQHRNIVYNILWPTLEADCTMIKNMKTGKENVRCFIKHHQLYKYTYSPEKGGERE